MDKIKELHRLKELLDSGVLSNEEYNQLKSEVIGGEKPKSSQGAFDAGSKSAETEATFIQSEDAHEKTAVSEGGKDSDLYKKDTTAFSQRGVTIFFLVIGALVLFYQLHDRNVFGLRDKMSSNDNVVIDVNDKVALEDYIQGKWSWERHTGDPNGTMRYRFEIIGNKLRIWNCMGNVKDPFDMGKGYDEFIFSLGDATRDVDGFNARYLEFGVFDTDYTLVYFGLRPFWVVADENWDEPVLRCSSGIPTWSRAEFQSTGTRMNISSSNGKPNQTPDLGMTDNFGDGIVEYENEAAFIEESSLGRDSSLNEHHGVADSKSEMEITVGSQVWMISSLVVNRFRNGDVIQEAKSMDEWNMALRNAAPAWCYFDFNSNSEVGQVKLYNWFAVNDERGLAPEGWHVPTWKEWFALAEFLSNQKTLTSETTCFSSFFGATNASSTSGFRNEANGYLKREGFQMSRGIPFWWGLGLGGSFSSRSINCGGELEAFFGGGDEAGFAVLCIRD